MRWLGFALRWLGFALRWARRSVALIVIAALLATNVLAFASTAFVGAVSGVAAMAGLTTVQARRALAQRAVLKRVGQRTARGAARSLGGAVAQSLPFVGVASVVGLTAWEVADACETMKDLAALAPDAADDPADVCGLTPPTTAEVYHAIAAGAGEWRSVSGDPPAAAPEAFDPAPPRR